MVLCMCERVGKALVAFLTKRRDAGEGGREMRSDYMSTLNKQQVTRCVGMKESTDILGTKVR